jgi:hypothetical protein
MIGESCPTIYIVLLNINFGYETKPNIRRVRCTWGLLGWCLGMPCHDVARHTRGDSLLPASQITVVWQKYCTCNCGIQ